MQRKGTFAQMFEDEGVAKAMEWANGLSRTEDDFSEDEMKYKDGYFTSIFGC